MAALRTGRKWVSGLHWDWKWNMGFFTTLLNPSNHLFRWEIVWRNAPRIWRDFGSVLPFQTRLTQTKPVLPLSNEHESQVKDQGRRQCCHNKHKKFLYQSTRDVSLLSWHASYILIFNCNNGHTKAPQLLVLLLTTSLNNTVFLTLQTRQQSRLMVRYIAIVHIPSRL